MPTRRAPSGGYRRVPGGYNQRSRPLFGVGTRDSHSLGGRRKGPMLGGLGVRVLIALAIVAFGLVTYYGNPGDVNEITGQRERVAIPDAEQEMALGQRAAPEMIAQHRGESRNREFVAQVRGVGQELLAGLELWMAQKEQELGVELRNPYEFRFTLLADPQTVNAFALPGGQVFITEALYSRLDTVGQLAGVLGHEIGHVIERHGNERMAEQQLFATIGMAGGALGGDAESARMGQMIAGMIQMKYGRDDELESDRWGVLLTERAGYDPRAMIGLMKVLEESSPSGGPPEFMSTHPKPANRVRYIQQVIADVFPDGVPEGLTP
ncbi:M48 family metalloprotease [Botrimarina sp.]|uniref:M48 family metalloprotease n=1 Tax=Botrimarina sp. TaxID=2795802 RepID=UPI0032EBB218